MPDWPTTPIRDDTVVLRPDARLNLAVAPDLREQLRGLVQGGYSRIVVDLSGVESIDSSGLGALVSGLKAARQAGGDLRITAPGPQVVAVLELTNLDKVLKTAATVEEAFDGAD